eukprot:gnl/MRDRNA2_/MRDRNA2_14871_c0_seq1.p1 gnl/MRDRNA2_/MRDRNA2_14871_c0~~gnl/MRDRNA2_/MRDRNA2_14871_c0_seq1.p1  ORF type:complete len:161 (-),score=10.92 gnl/MRDRNA2_/MRDRNA2_14871_c0_seq1:678-1124(-)
MENLGRNLLNQPIPGMSFLYLVATFCFAVNLQCSFPIFATALMAPSEICLGIQNSNVVVRILWKAVFMLGTTALGIVLKDCMSEVQSLTGCFCSTFTCLLMPLVFSLRMCKIGRSIRFVTILAILYGLYVLLYGTYSNVLHIIVKLDK